MGQIYQISYDSAKKLQSTYDGRLIYKTSDDYRKIYLR